MRIITAKEELKGRTLSALGMKPQKKVSLPQTYIVDDDMRENMALLESCRRYWESLRDFRNRRKRNRRYYRGDQWSDEIFDPDTQTYITEETYLKNQGKVPLKQNKIRELMKNLIGQYRMNPGKSVIIARARENATVTEMLTNALQCALNNNLAAELDARCFEEFGLSGAPVQKLGYKYFKNRNLEDLSVSNINPARIFFNSDVSDIRLEDLRLIGEIIDTTVDEIVSTFAKSTADEQRIRELYARNLSPDLLNEIGLSASRIDFGDFYIPYDPNKARLFEIWYLKGAWKTYAHDPVDGSYNIVPYSLAEIGRQNANRIEFAKQLAIQNGATPEEIKAVEEEVPLIEAESKFEQAWFVKYLTPNGYCLFESETPYKHEEHPYVMTLYPLLDGEVWGFVEDVIDQQRYINRLIIMMDFALGAGAKGVLMIPKDLIPDGMTPDDFAKKWVSFNGVIVYEPSLKHQRIPEQITTNSSLVGAKDLLMVQLNMLQDVSGVQGAIRGQSPSAGTPAARYAQEAQNATINSLDYMATFQAFQQKRDLKALKIITQYYKDKRYMAINGRTVAEEAKLYDPDLVRNLDFEVQVTQGSDTPVYRQIMDDYLMKLLEGQLINIEMFLEHTSLPFADKLLASVKAQKQAMLQGGGITLPPEIIQELQSDPKAAQLIQQFMGRPAA